MLARGGEKASHEVGAAREPLAGRQPTTHRGTYKLSDEPLDEPPLRLERARAALGVAAERVVILPVGGRLALGQR